MIKNAVVFLCFIALSACAGYNTLGITKPALAYPELQQVKQNSQQGIAIFSTSYASSAELGPAYIFVRSFDKQLDGILPMWKDEAGMSNAFYIKDPGEEIPTSGLVHTLLLSPGKYEIYHYYGTKGNQYFSANSRFELGFEVRAGEAVYLGNIHYGISKGDSIYSVRLENQFDRDIPVFRKNYMLDNSYKIQTRLVSFPR